jgi:hypothetical protein
LKRSRTRVNARDAREAFSLSPCFAAVVKQQGSRRASEENHVLMGETRALGRCAPTVETIERL